MGCRVSCVFGGHSSGRTSLEKKTSPTPLKVNEQKIKFIAVFLPYIMRGATLVHKCDLAQPSAKRC